MRYVKVQPRSRCQEGVAIRRPKLDSRFRTKGTARVLNKTCPPHKFWFLRKEAEKTEFRKM